MALSGLTGLEMTLDLRPPEREPGALVTGHDIGGAAHQRMHAIRSELVARSREGPVMLVVDGQATLGAELFGAMHVRALDWAAAGGGVLHGALIVENRMTGDASTTFSVAFDTDILRRLRWASGSFVLIPGGWRDF